MTLSKLAKLANVSVSTASKAFSMSEEVNEETRHMIFDIAKEQGCFKRFFSAKYPRPVVAVLCPELRSRFYGEQVECLKQALEERGFDMCLSVYDFNADTADSRMAYYELYTAVDAVISIGGKPPATAHEVPLLVMGEGSDDTDVSVTVDTLSVYEQIVDTCLAAGRKDIAFVGEQLTGSTERTVRHVMQQRGLPFRCAVVDDRFEEGGYAAMEQLLKYGVPQAVLCAYDDMAHGVLRCSHDHGLRVPQDFVVVGRNNVSGSAYTVPSLTSIDYAHRTVAQITVDALADIFAGHSVAHHVAVSATLVERESMTIHANEG